MKPLAEHYVCTIAEYYQLQNPKLKGRSGIAGQVIFDPKMNVLIEGRYSRPTGLGIDAEELLEIAQEFPGDPQEKNTLRLSWFLMDPACYRKDVVEQKDVEQHVARYETMERAIGEARKIRRPLIRVDGAALESLENHQEFLARHVRQFWWKKGDPKGPARLVVLHTWEFPPKAKPNNLTGDLPEGKVPAVMAVVDLAGGVDLAKISPVLDTCWSQYMVKRPPNNIWQHKENQLSYPGDQQAYLDACECMEETIRQAAREGKLLAPGGRKLTPKE